MSSFLLMTKDLKKGLKSCVRGLMQWVNQRELCGLAIHMYIQYALCKCHMQGSLTGVCSKSCEAAQGGPNCKRMADVQTITGNAAYEVCLLVQ